GVNIDLPIYFKLGSHTEFADNDSYQQFSDLVESLRSQPADAQYLIEGHTCSKGGVELNNKLSARRAQHIANLLASKGINLKLKATGVGEAEAINANVNEWAPESVLASYRKVVIHAVVTANQ
ncbi:MAG: OmpA family protein, partial [Verrucomicrobiota bacterium]